MVSGFRLSCLVRMVTYIFAVLDRMVKTIESSEVKFSQRDYESISKALDKFQGFLRG